MNYFCSVRKNPLGLVFLCWLIDWMQSGVCFLWFLMLWRSVFCIVCEAQWCSSEVMWLHHTHLSEWPESSAGRLERTWWWSDTRRLRAPGPPRTSPSPHPAPPECWASPGHGSSESRLQNIINTTKASGKYLWTHDKNLPCWPSKYTIFHITATGCNGCMKY